MSSRWTYFGIIAIGTGFATCMAFTLSLFTADKIMKFTKRKKVTRIIDTMRELGDPSVLINNPERVEDIVCHLIKGGASQLLVISDFDGTLLRPHCEGHRLCNSNHQLLLNKFSSQKSKSTLVSDEEPDDNVCIIEWYLSREEGRLGVRGQERLGELVSRELLTPGAGRLLTSPDIRLVLGAESLARGLLACANLLTPLTHLVSPGSLPHGLFKLLSSPEPPQSQSRPNVLVLSSSRSFLLAVSAALPPSTTLLSLGFFNPEERPDWVPTFDIVVSEPSLAPVNALIHKVSF